MKKTGLLIFAVAVFAIGWFVREAVGFSRTKSAAQEAELSAVTTVTVSNALFCATKEYVGHAEPVQGTDILPQVDGYIKRVCFTEGATVSKGDLLFEIDDEQYIAAMNLRRSEVESAKAKATVAKAELEGAERYYNRMFSVDDRSVSAADRDTAETALASAKAAMNAANAAVGQAEASSAIADFNLRHTKVYAPISGRIGKALHHVGDYVSPSKSALARVVQTDPMRVVFPVSDRDWTKFAAGGDDMRLRIVLPDGTTYGHEGSVEFCDNEMSRATATLAVRAAFPNPDGRLVANEFVRVLADARNAPEAVVVPTAALVRTEDRMLAWKIDDEGVAHSVAVETDGAWKGISRVKSGLSSGERIVLGGGFKLKDGDKVKVVEK